MAANAEDVLRYLRRRAEDDDAADLLAETLTTAWRRAAMMPADPVEARMWLFGVAHRTLLNHQRGARRRLRLADRLRDVLATTGHAPPADSGVEVRDAVSRLDPDLAELVRLVHWEGFTLAQVAEVVGMPASTVRNRYQRAKQELREALQAPAASLRE
ncbi:RNA polymerase sigma factor [Xylanimonas oleitrophica]|uniref:RNA polymerase sigma factor n=1 Tax=Xylanimonas oleitrophica TaxID=2607479 RepID=UPI001FE7A21E|nr:sigma-70 family RNA polymerase sigma factor [Xylanimonas oleitrophica]